MGVEKMITYLFHVGDRVLGLEVMGVVEGV